MDDATTRSLRWARRLLLPAALTLTLALGLAACGGDGAADGVASLGDDDADDASDDGDDVRRRGAHRGGAPAGACSTSPRACASTASTCPTRVRRGRRRRMVDRRRLGGADGAGPDQATMEAAQEACRADHGGRDRQRPTQMDPEEEAEMQAAGARRSRSACATTASTCPTRSSSGGGSHDAGVDERGDPERRPRNPRRGPGSLRDWRRRRPGGGPGGVAVGGPAVAAATNVTEGRRVSRAAKKRCAASHPRRGAQRHRRDGRTRAPRAGLRCLGAQDAVDATPSLARHGERRAPRPRAVDRRERDARLRRGTGGARPQERHAHVDERAGHHPRTRRDRVHRRRPTDPAAVRHRSRCGAGSRSAPKGSTCTSSRRTSSRWATPPPSS